MSSGAAFRTSVATFMHTGAAFAAQQRKCFRSASFLKMCTVCVLKQKYTTTNNQA